MNLYAQTLSVGTPERECLMGQRGAVVWLTGLSGAGKSTLANALDVALHARGVRTALLDGDNLRLGLNAGLGFDMADRIENVRRVTEVALLMADAGLLVLVALISPLRRMRSDARDRIGTHRFIEVFVDTPLAVCQARDPKGLYQRAHAGLVQQMTGVAGAYETPDSPDWRWGHQSPQAQNLDALLDLIQRHTRPASI